MHVLTAFVVFSFSPSQFDGSKSGGIARNILRIDQKQRRVEATRVKLFEMQRGPMDTEGASKFWQTFKF